MTLMTGLNMDSPAVPDPSIGLELDLEPVVESPDEEEEEEELPWGNDPATATWAPMMAEVNSSPRVAYMALTQVIIRSSAPIGVVHLR
jgi:hypothetical protein